MHKVEANFVLLKLSYGDQLSGQCWKKKLAWEQ